MYYKLTEAGEKFIRNVSKGTGNSKLSGKKVNPLPYSNSTADVIWTAYPIFQGNTITTNERLAEALIYWFNQYSKEYEINANYIAAQAFQESAYEIWTYNPYDAQSSGISQFEMPSFYEVVIKANYFNVAPLTSDEIAKFTEGMYTGKTFLINIAEGYNGRTSNAYYEIVRENRPIWHQNVINNPDLMIKAQCRYMKYIANQCNSLAGLSLLCYNRGIGYNKKVFSDSLLYLKNKTSDVYYKTGTDYVYKIFRLLYDNFGYRHLDMDGAFDEEKAKQSESQFRVK